MSTCPGTTFHPQSPNPPNPQSPVSWGAHPFLLSMSALITPNTIGSSQWIIGQASIMETIHFKASLIYETVEQAANVTLEENGEQAATASLMEHPCLKWMHRLIH